jgi:hypothetical protein
MGERSAANAKQWLFWHNFAFQKAEIIFADYTSTCPFTGSFPWT